MPDGLYISPLFGLQLCFQQQAGHSEHAVHRRADFMAHGREKARFCAVCRLGLVAGFRECVLQLFPLGNVAPDALDFDQAPRSIADCIVFPGNPAPAIACAHVLVVLDADLAGFQPCEAAEHGGSIVGVQFRRERLVQGGLCQAKQLEEGIIGICEPAIRCPPYDGVALRIDKPLITGFAFVESGVHSREVLERLLKPLGQKPQFIGARLQGGGAFGGVE